MNQRAKLVAREPASTCRPLQKERDQLAAHLELIHQLYHCIPRTPFVDPDTGEEYFRISPDLLSNMDRWHSLSPRQSLCEARRPPVLSIEQAYQVAVSSAGLLGIDPDDEVTVAEKLKIHAFITAVLKSAAEVTQ